MSFDVDVSVRRAGRDIAVQFASDARIVALFGLGFDIRPPCFQALTGAFKVHGQFPSPFSYGCNSNPFMA